ncbi:hypothetical protein KC330_g8989 [Hortaea werneckii]|nr:hypothetical protein KC330_g8989 [Hortaea werneckii]
MAAQQIAFAETLRAMKLAIKRNRAASPHSSSSDSDDDDGLHTHTNRGNKLNRSARYAKSGRLDTTGGQAWKRKVHHAGHDRYIVNKKPKLYDEDGDVIDPQDLPSDVDEDDVHLYGEPVKEDAFAGGTRLEQLLRPLTSAAELPDHPSLSEAYTSRALTRMCQDAAEMVRREKATLWKAKRLLQRLRGDGGWMACGDFETEQDEWLLRDEEDIGGDNSTVPSIVETDIEAVPSLEQGGVGGLQAEPSEFPAAQQRDAETNGDAMDGVEAHDHLAEQQEQQGDEEKQETDGQQTEESDQAQQQQQPVNGDNADSDQHNHNNHPPPPNPTITDLREKDDSDSRSSTSHPSTIAPSHAMTTRAGARARSPPPATSPSPTPSDSASIPPIHPWYLTPPSALLDRNLGLPVTEAEETRRILLLYIQKQENILRQLEQLFSGLQRAERLRTEYWRACKAEGHMVSDGRGGVMTEMSDGEDWYDPADWGLTARELNAEGQLEKGKDEVEDVAEEEGRRVGGRRRRVVGKG